MQSACYLPVLSTIRIDALGCRIATLESVVLIKMKNSSISSTISSNVTDILLQRLRLSEESGTNVTETVAAS